MRVAPFLPTVSLVAVCLLAGCGRPQKVEMNYPVSGTVRVDGKPLENGMVSFLPADGKGGGTTAMVQNGAFECGVAPGEKNVGIHDVKNQRSYDNPSKPLTAEVKPDAENRFEFDVKSGGK
ncbi:MAG: hypothetical protein ACKOHG_11645 [Planctomycetia bacterium]